MDTEFLVGLQVALITQVRVLLGDLMEVIIKISVFGGEEVNMTLLNASLYYQV